MLTGRFAPSPTGLLHAGSLVAALASWLDARAQHGRWLVRIEDLDPPREAAGAAETILAQLARCGLRPDETPLRQSLRGGLYDAALSRLVAARWAYACGCSRTDIVAAVLAQGGSPPRHAEIVYPNTCRTGLHGKPPRAMRLRVAERPQPQAGAELPVAGTADSLVVAWHDRRLGARQQDVAREVGDFVLKRADGFWAYQLAVVVDDAAQGITDVVRGEDLADNTPRQIVLQRRLGLPTPRYLHAPLVLGANGEKLSKQNGAVPLDLAAPLLALREAGATLDIRVDGTSIAHWLEQAVAAWQARWAAGHAVPAANRVDDGSQGR